MNARSLCLASLLLLAASGLVAGEAVRGILHVAGGVEASGASALSATDPVLVLRPTADASLSLSIPAGVLERYWVDAVALDDPLLPGENARIPDTANAKRDEITLVDTAAKLVGLRADPFIFVGPLDGGAGATLASTDLADVAIVGRDPFLVESHPTAGRTPGELPLYLRHEIDVPHLNVSFDGTATVTGDFLLYVFGLDLVADGTTYSSGYVTEQDGVVARKERGERQILEIRGGTLTVSGDLRLATPALRFSVDGAAALHGATGEVASGERAFRADGEDVLLSGSFDALVGVAPGADGVLSDRAPGAILDVAGEVTPVGFAARDLPKPLLSTATVQAGAAAGGGLLLALLGGTVAWQARRRRQAPEGLVEDAVLRLEAGDHQGALEGFNRAVAGDPRNAVLHLDRAHCLDRMGRVAEARRALELAVRYAPESAEAHYQLARSLAATGLAPSAIAHLTRAFGLDPDYAAAARDDPAFVRLGNHPSYLALDAYYKGAVGPGPSPRR